MKRAVVGIIGLSIALVLVLGVSGNAWSVEKVFKGKTIRFIVGASPGGGYDTYTRTVARHISKHMPGNPTPVVQNLTGAGGLIVANYLYNKVKANGLTAGVWNNVFLLHEALGSRRVNFKGRNYGWVGAPVTGWPSCAVMGFTGLKSWDDLVKSGKPLKVGSSGGTGTTLPTILNIASGKNLFDIVPGYKGTAIVRLALQARELGGVCMAFESMRVTARSMLDAKGDDKLIPILVHGSPPDKEVQGLPRVTDLVQGKDNVEMLNAWAVQYNFQRPVTLPPGTPKEVLAAWRKAYAATLKDPAFLADAKKSKLNVVYVSGEEAEKHTDTILSMSAETKERLKWMLPK
jgi:tripartite-type tricarboxylate transporter receptor subunit TctC